MLRILTPLGGRPIKATYTASENMVQGMSVSLDTENAEVDKATGNGDYIVDVPKSYTGIYSVVNPKDDDFEEIASGKLVNVIPAYLGDRFATDQVTALGLDVGDPLTAAAGLFVKATAPSTSQWVFGGTYADPTGTLYIVERVPSIVVT